MAHQSGRPQRQTNSAEAFLNYAGIAGIVIAIVLTLVVGGLTVFPALVPSGAVLGTTLFTLLLGGVVVGIRRIHRSRGREMDVDTDWH